MNSATELSYDVIEEWEFPHHRNKHFIETYMTVSFVERLKGTDYV
jgi:hypothetical protein